jgi:hypothetical protein
MSEERRRDCEKSSKARRSQAEAYIRRSGTERVDQSFILRLGSGAWANWHERAAIGPNHGTFECVKDRAKLIARYEAICREIGKRCRFGDRSLPTSSHRSARYPPNARADVIGRASAGRGNKIPS